MSPIIGSFTSGGSFGRRGGGAKPAAIFTAGATSYDFNNVSTSWNVQHGSDNTYTQDITVTNPGWVRLEMWGASRDTAYRNQAPNGNKSSGLDTGLNNQTSRGFGAYAASNLFLPIGTYRLHLNHLSYAGARSDTNYGAGGGLCGLWSGTTISANTTILIAGSAGGGTYASNTGGNGGGIWGSGGSNNGLTGGGIDGGGGQSIGGDGAGGYTCSGTDGSQFSGGTYSGSAGAGGGAGWYGGAGGRGHCGQGGGGGGGGSSYLGKNNNGTALTRTGSGTNYLSWRSGFYSDFSNYISTSLRTNTVNGLTIQYGGQQYMLDGGYNNSLTNTVYNYGRFQFSYPTGSI